MSEITPDVVAAFLTGTDNDYAEDLDGWPGLHSEGNVLHISVTPAKETSYGSTADDDNKAYFEAHILPVEPPAPVAAAPVELPADLARELAGENVGEAYEGWTVVANDYLEKQRWESLHWLVIRNEQGEHFAGTYRRGLTESQDTRPYEYETTACFDPVARRVKVVQTIEWVAATAKQTDGAL